MRSNTVLSCVMSLALIAVGGASIEGCLRRPVVSGEPTTTTNFTQQLATEAVDKIDLLFAIDNSASMGDKQAYLEQAIPSLVNRLLTPNCVADADGTTLVGQSQPSANGGDPTCPSGSELEFPAVHDMHIGIVSSSLGPRLGDAIDGKGAACLANATVQIGGVSLDNHNDDSAHLLTRSSTAAASHPTETTLADAPAGFLAWFPGVTENDGKDAGSPAPIADPKQLETDFSDLVAGVHEYGCGIESQLESWYRFLVQPDPYATLQLDTNHDAQWVGVDTTILKQRHDFLRPDSLVAVIVLTDENDSEIDVRSLGGKGYQFMAGSWSPPRGTSACATNPSDPSCQPCAAGSADPACAKGPYVGATDWGDDLNLRHVHMQQKYGESPQFPLSRYVNGLTSPTIPNRDGEYPSGATSYQGTANCQNPLFAQDLPDGTTLSANVANAFPISAADTKTLCNLTPSTKRTKNLVFFAIIGGVPHQLLHFDPNSAANSELNAGDWKKILGNDPDDYDYSGIDYHMVESYQPRTGLTNIAALTGDETAAQPPGTAVDAWNGGEWTTDGVNASGAPLHVDLPVDRQYACTFKLGAARDCSNAIVGGNRVWTVPENGFACDCSSTGLATAQTSPVCDRTTPSNQVAAKAYPTIRELDLAHKLGDQGIVSSICPIDAADNATGDDPLYGYRPAVASIVNRLKNALTNQCLPHALTPDPATGNIPCLILATLSSTTPANASNPEADCNDATYPGLSAPNASALADFLQQAEASWRANGGAASDGSDPATLPTCQVNELTGSALTNGSCKTSSAEGWCYVTGTAAGVCDQAVLFSPQTLPAGARVNLQCLETLSVPDGG
jgi:hypothetical protein